SHARGARHVANRNALRQLQSGDYDDNRRTAVRCTESADPLPVPDCSAIRQIRPSDGPRPSYQMATAIPPDTTASPVEWERPILHVQIDLGAGRIAHVVNVHLKSKLASTIPGQKIDNFTWRSVSAWAEGSFISAMKRVGQALQARLLIDDLL